MTPCPNCTPENCIHYAHCVERNPAIQRAEMDHFKGPSFPEEQKLSEPWPDFPLEDQI